MAGGEDKLENLFLRVKEMSDKTCLKFSIQKTKIMASSPINSWQIEEGKVETVTYFVFLGLKTTALTIWTFAGKVMSLFFNMLPLFVIAFLSRRSKCHDFMAAVTVCSDFEAQENKICHCFHFFHFCLL